MHRRIENAAVREKAYQLWRDRGCPTGNPLQDWIEAEQLLRADQRIRYGLREIPTAPGRE